MDVSHPWHFETTRELLNKLPMFHRNIAQQGFLPILSRQSRIYAWINAIGLQCLQSSKLKPYRSSHGIDQVIEHHCLMISSETEALQAVRLGPQQIIDHAGRVFPPIDI